MIPGKILDVNLGTLFSVQAPKRNATHLKLFIAIHITSSTEILAIFLGHSKLNDHEINYIRVLFNANTLLSEIFSFTIVLLLESYVLPSISWKLALAVRLITALDIFIKFLLRILDFGLIRNKHYV